MINGFINPFPLYWYSQQVKADDTTSPPIYAGGIPREGKLPDARIVNISPAYYPVPAAGGGSPPLTQEQLFCSLDERMNWANYIPIVYSRPSRITQIANRYCSLQQQQQIDDDDQVVEEHPVWVVHNNCSWTTAGARRLDDQFSYCSMISIDRFGIGPGRVCAMAMPKMHEIRRRVPYGEREVFVLEGPVYFVIGAEFSGGLSGMLAEDEEDLRRSQPGIEVTSATKRALEAYTDSRDYWLRFVDTFDKV